MIVKKMRKIIEGRLNNNINMYSGSFFLFLPATFYALADFTQRKESEYGIRGIYKLCKISAYNSHVWGKVYYYKTF